VRTGQVRRHWEVVSGSGGGCLCQTSFVSDASGVCFRRSRGVSSVLHGMKRSWGVLWLLCWAMRTCCTVAGPSQQVLRSCCVALLRLLVRAPLWRHDRRMQRYATADFPTLAHLHACMWHSQQTSGNACVACISYAVRAFRSRSCHISASSADQRSIVPPRSGTRPAAWCPIPRMCAFLQVTHTHHVLDSLVLHILGLPVLYS
jgi:hypothetical protein